MPCEKNKEADSICRAAPVAEETFVVLDNTGSLLGAVNVVTRLIERLCVRTRKESDISEMGDVDDANRSMKSKALEEE